MLVPRASLLVVAALTAASIAPLAHAQTVRRGPVFNPATGTRYYAIEARYDAARAWAQQRVRGDLATISSAAENTFVTNTFSVPQPQDKVQIGLTDVATEGTFVWADGSTSAYRNWSNGTPASAGNSPAQDYVQIAADGEWRVRNDGDTPYTLVESSAPLQVPGEFATLDAALNFANSIGGATIELAPGAYDLPASYAFSVPVTLRATGPGVELRSVFGSSTNISVLSPLRIENMAVTARLTSSPMFQVGFNSRIDLVNVTLSSLGGATSPSIFAAAGPVNIERSVVRSVGSVVTFSGSSSSASVSITNSVLRDMGAVVAPSGSGISTRVTNSTLVNVGISGASVFGSSFTTALVNSVVVNPNAGFYNGPVQVSHSLVPAAVPAGNNAGGNVVGAPLFANAAAGDFRLLPNSPGIDAGALSAYFLSGASSFTDFAGVLRAQDVPAVPNTGQGELAIDIGAFELPVAPPPPACRADFNNDTELTFDDIQLFIAAFNAGC